MTNTLPTTDVSDLPPNPECTASPHTHTHVHIRTLEIPSVIYTPVSHQHISLYYTQNLPAFLISNAHRCHSYTKTQWTFTRHEGVGPHTVITPASHTVTLRPLLLVFRASHSQSSILHTLYESMQSVLSCDTHTHTHSHMGCCWQVNYIPTKPSDTVISKTDLKLMVWNGHLLETKCTKHPYMSDRNFSAARSS